MREIYLLLGKLPLNWLILIKLLHYYYASTVLSQKMMDYSTWLLGLLIRLGFITFSNRQLIWYCLEVFVNIILYLYYFFSVSQRGCYYYCYCRIINNILIIIMTLKYFMETQFGSAQVVYCGTPNSVTL